MKKLKKPLIVLVGVIALLAAGFGISQAAIPGSDGVISACYRNTMVQNTLRVIDSEGTCNTNETLLRWNQTGPQGPAGPAGGNLGPDVSPGGNTGHYVDVDYGSILVGDTPVRLMSIPGFGHVDITLCDAEGNSHQVFTNTSGTTLINFFQQSTIPPGGTIDGPDGVQILLAKGNGPTSQTTQIGTNYWNRTDVSKCAFHGINL